MASGLTEDDLSGAFEFETLARGAELRQRKHVGRVEAAADGLRITGSVLGSQRRPYTQTVSLVPVRGGHGVRIVGYCTCRMGRNCKHVAALLMEHLAALDETDAESAPPPPASVPVALSEKVAGWLDRVTSAAAPPVPRGAEVFRSNQRQLRYILNHRAAPAGAGSEAALVRAVSVRLKKDGGFHDEKRYDPNNATRPEIQLPQFVTADDTAILRDLDWVRQKARLANAPDTPLGADAAGLRLLEAMLATGRLYHGTADSPTLRSGPELAAEPRWVKSGHATQRLTFVPAVAAPTGDGERSAAQAPLPETAAARIDAVLPFKPLYYLDGCRGLVGRLVTALPEALAQEVARAPEITASEAVLIKGSLSQRLRPTDAGETAPAAAFALPLPEAPDNMEMREAVAPVPRLELHVADIKLQPTYMWYAADVDHDGTYRLPLARLAFDYDGTVVADDAPTTVLERMEGDKLVLTPRHKAAEAKARERLAELGLRPLAHSPLQAGAEHAAALYLPPPGKPNPYEIVSRLEDASRYVAFSLEAVPKLRQEGWQVAFTDDYPYRVAEGEAAWWADVGDGSGIDWFAFELGVDYEGHRINLVPHLTGLLGRLSPKMLEAARADDGGAAFARACRTIQFYHPLPDGRMLPLPGARLAPILKALLDLVGPHADRVADGKVKLHRAEAGALAAFADGTDRMGLAWAASAERLLGLGQRLKGGVKVAPIAPPPSFKAALRPYQGEGLSWLGFLREAQFGGVLADDMGLGKTVQALAFLAHEKAEGRLDKPALIVSPTSVLPNWQAEAERFAPELSVLPLRGLERRQMFDRIPQHDLVLTTYPLLARDHEVLLAQEFHVTILDEAQAIKNPKAGVSALAHRLKARHRLALTGTPLENNLGEVWSLFEFLSPGLLGDESTFRRTFRTPIEKHGDRAAQAFLSRRLKPFMLRRTKEEVATELPPKTEIVEHVRARRAHSAICTRPCGR